MSGWLQGLHSLDQLNANRSEFWRHTSQVHAMGLAPFCPMLIATGSWEAWQYTAHMEAVQPSIQQRFGCLACTISHIHAARKCSLCQPGLHITGRSARSIQVSNCRISSFISLHERVSHTSSVVGRFSVSTAFLRSLCLGLAYFSKLATGDWLLLLRLVVDGTPRFKSSSALCDPSLIWGSTNQSLRNVCQILWWLF